MQVAGVSLVLHSSKLMAMLSRNIFYVRLRSSLLKLDALQYIYDTYFLDNARPGKLITQVMWASKFFISSLLGHRLIMIVDRHFCYVLQC